MMKSPDAIITITPGFLTGTERVKVSNNPAYPEGTLVLSLLGWRSLTLVTDPEAESFFGPIVRKMPDFGDLPPSLALGCLGMPG